MSRDLNEKLTSVFATKWASEGHVHYAEMIDKFVFHMTDAAADIGRLAKALEEPAQADPEAFGKLLHRFFLHALPHLIAAGQLYDYVPVLFAEQRGVHSLSEARDERGGDKGN